MRERDKRQEAKDAKDDVVEYFGADGDDEGRKYHESGSVHPELDDQTIAPPG